MLKILLIDEPAARLRDAVTFVLDLGERGMVHKVTMLSIVPVLSGWQQNRPQYLDALKATPDNLSARDLLIASDLTFEMREIVGELETSLKQFFEGEHCDLVVVPPRAPESFASIILGRLGVRLLTPWDSMQLPAPVTFVSENYQAARFEKGRLRKMA